MKRNVFLALFIGITGITSSQNTPISGGLNYSLRVGHNQQISVWGANTSGQLSVDASGTPISQAYRNTPAFISVGNVSLTTTPQIGTLPSISKADAGSGAHILALSCDQQVWAWGDNTTGQLGRNTFGTTIPASPIPSRVLKGAQSAARNNSLVDPNDIYLDGISYVNGGSASSYALEEGSGYVLAWGNNAYGQLGDGTTVNRSAPVYVLKEDGTRLTNIVAVEAGDACAYALDASGFVWSWGMVSDASFPSYTLGRTVPAASIIPAAVGGSSTCAPRAGKVVISDPLNPGYSICSTNPLSNIVQISAGMTHCIALDKKGNVWSFGGDWGGGQLGRGGQMVFQNCASRVVAPGVIKTGNWVESDFLGSGQDGKALHVAASQASSAVVMANGKVVTFGARGLYNNGLVATGPGSSIGCPTAGGDIILAGTLGDNNVGCNSNSCTGKQTAGAQSLTPVYVTGIPTGEKIAQVSAGSAWFFAISSTQQLYGWGWNRRGELGLGDFVDRCQAAQITTAGSTTELPCAAKPDLGADLTLCPINMNYIIEASVSPSPTATYKWYYLPSLSAGKTLVQEGGITLKVFYTGYYILDVADTRASVASECGPCKVQSDTIRIVEPANPYTTAACYDTKNQVGEFKVLSPATAKIKWYATATGTTALNPTDELATITSSAQQQALCGGQPGLFAEDIASSAGAIIATGSDNPTVLQVGNALLCQQSSWNNFEGNNANLMLQVSQSLTLTSVSILYYAPGPITTTASLSIYGNNPTGNFCNACTPARPADGKGTLLHTLPFAINYTGTNTYQVITIPVNVTLPAGKYWLGTNAQGHVSFNCNRTFTANSHLWQSPLTDENGALKAVTAYKTGAYSSSGAYFNLKYTVGTGYSCKRFLVCATEVCVITEVDDLQLGQAMSISPNPNTGTFKLTVPSELVHAEISIFNTLGHTVYKGQAIAAVSEISLGKLSAGVYMLKASTAKQSKVLRLVVE